MKTLLKNGLKISPKKCQLFKKELQYMGNVIFIKDRKVCVKPLRSRPEAMQKLRLPTAPKGCRRFTGMPNHEGRFHLYSDTSKFTAGSALYQIQNGQPRLIAYASKRFP